MLSNKAATLIDTVVGSSVDCTRGQQLDTLFSAGGCYLTIETLTVFFVGRQQLLFAGPSWSEGFVSILVDFVVVGLLWGKKEKTEF